MGWKNWKLDMTLLQYHGEWYRTHDDMQQGQQILQYFDTVVEVKGNNFNVIKNRHTGITGNKPGSDLLRIKLFAKGKTLWDLPKFTKSPSVDPGGNIIGYKDNGDLFEYPHPTRTL